MKLEKLRKDWYYEKKTLIRRKDTMYLLYDKNKDFVIKSFKTKKEMVNWVKENKDNYQRPKTKRLNINDLFLRK